MIFCKPNLNVKSLNDINLDTIPTQNVSWQNEKDLPLL